MNKTTKIATGVIAAAAIAAGAFLYNETINTPAMSAGFDTTYVKFGQKDTVLDLNATKVLRYYTNKLPNLGVEPQYELCSTCTGDTIYKIAGPGNFSYTKNQQGKPVVQFTAPGTYKLVAYIWAKGCRTGDGRCFDQKSYDTITVHAYQFTAQRTTLNGYPAAAVSWNFGSYTPQNLRICFTQWTGSAAGFLMNNRYSVTGSSGSKTIPITELEAGTTWHNQTKDGKWYLAIGYANPLQSAYNQRIGRQDAYSEILIK